MGKAGAELYVMPSHEGNAAALALNNVYHGRYSGGGPLGGFHSLYVGDQPVCMMLMPLHIYQLKFKCE